jgi:hypothetical protein
MVPIKVNAPALREALALVGPEIKLVNCRFPHVLGSDEALGPRISPADVQKRALGTVAVEGKRENGDLRVVCVVNMHEVDCKLLGTDV